VRLLRRRRGWTVRTRDRGWDQCYDFSQCELTPTDQTSTSTTNPNITLLDTHWRALPFFTRGRYHSSAVPFLVRNIEFGSNCPNFTNIIIYCLLPTLYFLVVWAWWDLPLTWLTNHRPSSFSAMTLLAGSSDPTNRPRNDLQCVEWDVKPCYTTPYKYPLSSVINMLVCNCVCL